MFNDEYDDVEEVDVVETTTDEETIEEQDTEKEELRAENTRLKKILDRNKEYVKEAKSASKQNSPQKSDDFGLDVKSYLKSSGIKSDEFDFVKAELKRAGGDIDALLDNEYFQAKLEKHRELAKTAEATPTGKRSGGVATDSVEYWLAKPIEDVPKEMRIKVVNAKLEQEKNKGIFYNS